MTDDLDDVRIRFERGGKPIEHLIAGDPPATLYTVGLTDRGLPEFELVGIPGAFLNPAVDLLLTWADAMVNRKRIPAGQFWGSRRSDGSVAGGMLVDAGKRLRMTNLGGEPDGPASDAVCSMAIEQARAEEDSDTSIAQLRAIVEWYPGVDSPNPEEPDGINCNMNNNLAYLALAAAGDEPDVNYARALARSNVLLASELGGGVAFNGVELLETYARALVTKLHALDLTKLPDGPAAGVRFHLSPILKVVDREIQQSLAIGPETYRSYFYDGVVRERLCSPEIAWLAAEIYAAWYLAPANVLTTTRETAWDIYEVKPDAETASRVVEIEEVPLDVIPLLSRILAGLGRDLAAGLSLDELSARWRLDGADEAAATRADAKLEALRSREGAEILAAYGFG